MSNILKDPRASEYFTEDGLVMVTGISKYKWVEMFIKEPIDNSLDTLKNTSNKEIKIVYRNNLWGVCDSGNGIPEQDLDSIYDFAYYVSSKRHYRHVSRGALGNAIKCLIGVSYLRNLNLSFVLNKKR
jgi:DNA topoisomerase VI subunit B